LHPTPPPIGRRRNCARERNRRKGGGDDPYAVSLEEAIDRRERCKSHGYGSQGGLSMASSARRKVMLPTKAMIMPAPAA